MLVKLRILIDSVGLLQKVLMSCSHGGELDKELIVSVINKIDKAVKELKKEVLNDK